MELHLPYFLLSIILVIVIWQDLKQRTIHFMLPLLVFFVALVINFLNNQLDYIMTIKNIVFISVNIVGLIFYFSFKKRAFVNPIDSMIGLGDILFFLAITPLFNLNSYIVFFVTGMIFSLLIHIVVGLFINQESVPLAGYLAIFLIGFIILEHGLNLNLVLR